MPEKLQFFIDPFRVLQSYKTCSISKKAESLKLEDVWTLLDNESRELEGAHDSLVDAKAQSDVLLHRQFVPFINRTKSVKAIKDIFDAKQRKALEKANETKRKVHKPWKEVTVNDDLRWEPRNVDAYNGSEGGPQAGPTSHVIDRVKASESLLTIFLTIIPLPFFISVAEMTKKYCYDDFVVEKEARDRHNNPKKRRYLVQADASTPGARHRADKVEKKYNITAGFVIAWIGIMILLGGHFGSNKKSSRKLWKEPPFGLPLPYVQNTMPRNAFEFMRRFIHFADNSKKIPKGQAGYDALYKVRLALTVFMEGMRRVWRAGEIVAIDESMIKYMGRAVSFVQYMPKKPIKHGIKVFACCCAVSAVLLSFEVYVGKESSFENEDDKSTLMICDRLITMAQLTVARGRMLVTDNYYTSVALAIHLFEKYGWTLVGTTVVTEKKTRSGFDLPFSKLSYPALKELPRGWYREAVICLKTKTGKLFCVQCSTWKDNKQVTFLSSNRVGASSGLTVTRQNKGGVTETFAAPMAQRDYAQNFNAVDRNDRDSADYSTSMRTNRYYLRIYHWLLDRVIHTAYVVMEWLVNDDNYNGQLKETWRMMYCNRESGRGNFQIALGLEIIAYGISLDWDGKSEKPNWMRQSPLLPCTCGMCYFCLNGMTNKAVHGKKGKALATIEYKCEKRMRTSECTEERVTVQSYSCYCRMCYRKNDDEQITSKQKKNLCKRSSMGCAICQEPICKQCWAEGYDLHMQQG